jgi:hypothetical protein
LIDYFFSSKATDAKQNLDHSELQDKAFEFGFGFALSMLNEF